MTLQHIMYRNQGTDWLNVCSVQCPLCRLNRELRACSTLAHNLTIAGALCRAYDLGEIGIDVGPGVRFELPSGGIAWMPDAIWRPGCGRPAP